MTWKTWASKAKLRASYERLYGQQSGHCDRKTADYLFNLGPLLDFDWAVGWGESVIA